MIDDQWIQGQIATVRELIDQPLNLRQLDDVERRLKDLIYKQSALKKSLNDAQRALKAMLATFVDRLADFASTTGEYHDRIGVCAEKVSRRPRTSPTFPTCSTWSCRKRAPSSSPPSARATS